MAGKTQGSYAATCDYRFGDKLKAVTSSFLGEAPSVGYNYDGLGKRRVEQLGTSTLTWFRWLGMEESGEYTGTPGSWTVGAMQTGYVPGLATFAGANPSTAEWRYHLTDHLGSVRQLSAQNKAALARYDYAPYGELMRSAGLPLTVGYTGHRWDPAIGQYFAPFRYYNPQTARWNMRDPLDFVDGPNVYAYVAGNPSNNYDEYGLDGCKWPGPKPIRIGGVNISHVHTGETGVEAHRMLENTGERFNRNGVIIKGPNKGKNLKDLPGMKKIVKHLKKIGVIISKIPIIIFTPIIDLQIPNTNGCDTRRA